MDDDVLQAARRVAGEVLLPAADALDRSGHPPAAQLDALARAGLYGLAGPRESGGSDCDLPTFCEVVELLAAACLTTTFVWIQHHGVVRAVSRAPEPLRGAHLAALCRGERRGGVVLAGLKPGPPSLIAREHGGAWTLDGEVPWFTGWGLVDRALVVARTERDRVLFALLDLPPRDGSIAFTPGDLLALGASATGSLRFETTAVPEDRVLGVETPSGWSDGNALRPNGALGLGVADRCLDELAEPTAGPLRRELGRLRARLHGGHADTVAGTRAEIAALSLRCSGALLAAQGSRGIDGAGTPARRYREAGFLLTFGQRPEIRTRLLERLAS